MMENIYSNIQYKSTFSKAGIKRQTNPFAFETNHMASSGINRLELNVDAW